MVDGNMISRDLEFRGINRRSLEIYFEELGGKRRQNAGLNDDAKANTSAINIAIASNSAIENAIDSANVNPEPDGFPTVFVGDGWEGQILSEEEISFTTVIKVNAVRIRFLATDEAGLAELIKKYRFKTTRVGG